MLVLGSMQCAQINGRRGERTQLFSIASQIPFGVESIVGAPKASIMSGGM
jgi:hypothetical protein